MGITSIEWTDRTWNPVRGCSRVSEGCRNCYAERQAARFAGNKRTTKAGTRTGIQPFTGFVQITNGHPQWTGKVELVEKHLEDPLHWRKPCKVFVNSMSDLFHENLPDEEIDRVFAVMALCPQHTFQILTKRPERMLKYLTRGVDDEFMRETMDEAAQEFQACHANMNQPERWPLPNVWLGVSVEDRANKDRVDILRQVPAAVRFLSIEPLLEDIGTLNLGGIHWAIVGGESGPGARPMHPDWVRSVRDQCQGAGVAFFFKQWGEWFPCMNYEPVPAGSLRILSGKEMILKPNGETYETPLYNDIPRNHHQMHKVGKKYAGAILDSREWREFPKAAEVSA